MRVNKLWIERQRLLRGLARLSIAVGGRHVILVPVPGYRDDTTGAYLEPGELDPQAWATMVRAADELG